MNTTELVVEVRPEKNSGPYGIELIIHHLKGLVFIEHRGVKDIVIAFYLLADLFYGV